jgi:hypothetical protein
VAKVLVSIRMDVMERMMHKLIHVILHADAAAVVSERDVLNKK